ncbi:MAG: hypothetical protein ABUR63_01780 [Verrucomicrobiota bacterium]
MVAEVMMRSFAAVLVVLGMTVGCGSSSPSVSGGTGGTGGHGSGGSGGGSGDCQPFIAGDGVITWLANGTAECATATLATRMTGGGTDFLEIVGATASVQSSMGIALTVSSLGPPLGGTYVCKGDGGAYVDFVYTSGTVQSCSITILDPGAPGGAHARGTFSATVTVGGAPVQLTDGAFDTKITMIGG